MKRALIFLIAILVCTLSISTTKAFFGCAPTQDPNKYAHIWKDSTGNFHLSLCFTPNENVQTLLRNNDLQYMNGEIRPIEGNFNVQIIEGRYIAHAGNVLLDHIISYLSDQTKHLDSKTIDQADKISSFLKILSLFLVEDHLAKINYISDTITLDWNGIISSGIIEVPTYHQNKTNIIHAGEIISKYYLNGQYTFYSQEEMRLSGLRIEFLNSKERRLIWLQEGYFAKYDVNDNLQDKFTATTSTRVLYKTIDKKLKKEKGTLYRNNEELKDSQIKFALFFGKEKTQICCLTMPNYCITADEKHYPLKFLTTDCSFSIGTFNIKHEKEETSITTPNLNIIYTRDIKKILELIS